MQKCDQSHLTTPEQDFLRWRTNGDAAALGRVFDQLAPELLLVAGHLAARGSAEDLVQTVFLRAIEGADRWDSARRLMPWLLGILLRLSQRDRASRARERDGTRGEGANGLVAHDAPPLAAEREEVAQAVTAALADLPIPYRQALTLRLVHGFQPAAIAHALGVPPDTIKSRLRRGLERLRRALPTGMGAPALFVNTPRDLDAVRSVVMARGARRAAIVQPTAVMGAAAFGGVAFMSISKLVAACLAAVALVSGLLYWSSKPLGRPPLESRSGGVSRASEPLATPVKAAGPPSARVSLADLGQTDPGPENDGAIRAEPHHATISVHTHRSTPVVGAQVEVRLAHRSKELATSTTDDDGSASYLVRADLEGLAAALTVSAAGFETQRLEGLVFGRSYSILLESAELRLEGRVQDESGAAVRHARVSFQRIGDLGGVAQTIETGVDGRFSFAVGANAAYHLSAAARGFGADSHAVEIGEIAPNPVALTLASMHRGMQCQVLDASSGRPISGAVIESRLGLQTVTNFDGTAIIDWLPIGGIAQEEVTVHVPGVVPFVWPLNWAADEHAVRTIRVPVTLEFAVVLDVEDAGRVPTVIFEVYDDLGQLTNLPAEVREAPWGGLLAVGQGIVPGVRHPRAVVDDAAFERTTAWPVAIANQAFTAGDVPTLLCRAAKRIGVRVFDPVRGIPHRRLRVAAIADDSPAAACTVDHLASSVESPMIDDDGSVLIGLPRTERVDLVVFDLYSVYYRVAVHALESGTDGGLEVPLVLDDVRHWVQLDVEFPEDADPGTLHVHGPQGQSFRPAARGASLPFDLTGWSVTIARSTAERTTVHRFPLDESSGDAVVEVRFDK